jgi:mRNA interferase MazF
MKKDFDKWNKQKKEIHNTGENKFYKPKEVWWCNLGVNVGFEQDGSGELNERPVVILRGFSSQVCLIVPLTTSKKRNKYHFDLGIVGDSQAFAIISQIRLIDTKRLSNRITILNKGVFNSMKKTVKELL